MSPSKETKTSLPIAGTEFEREVLDRLVRGASRLPGRDPRSHLFLESRFERRLEIDTDGREVAVAARVLGVAAEARPGEGVFLSTPSLEEIEQAGVRTLRRQLGQVEEIAFPVPDASDPDARELAQALRSLARRTQQVAEGATARVTWVEVDQRVAVARRDGWVACDRRRGRRVLLEIADAAVERVLSGDEIDLQDLAEEGAARAKARGSLLRPPAHRGWVVFAPGAGGVLIHELLGHALEADVIARGGSKLARAGRPLAPSGVTVIDDPRRARVPWKIDDEGSETHATVLVDGGQAVGALGSWRWPDPRGIASGHARRASFSEPALPRMGATFLTPGPLHPEEVWKGIARGVYVRRLSAAWTDPSLGTATFHVTDADLLLDGRLAGALAPFLLVACLEDLGSLDRIANDLAFDPCVGVCVREGQALATGVGAPTFRLGLVSVPM